MSNKGRVGVTIAFALVAAAPLRSQRVSTARNEAPKRALRGIRFFVDTLETPVGWRGELSQVVGTVEFVGGRGRFTVTAVRGGPAVAMNGVVVATPLAARGDYYLFDSTGFVLVKPSARTFSRFVFTRSDYNHDGGFLAGQFLMKHTPWHTDTLDAAEAVRRRQHAPASIHWHLDSLDARGPVKLYARGWLEIQDVPASEAGVARWFGVAMELGNRPGGVATLPRDQLQITSVALLRRPGDREGYLRYLGLLTPHGLTAADVDPSRLVLPSGYRETPWPGFTARPALSATRPASARAPRGATD